MNELSKLTIKNIKSDINNNPDLVRLTIEVSDLKRLVSMSERCERLDRVNKQLNNNIRNTVEYLTAKYYNNKIKEEDFKEIVELLDAMHLCRGVLYPAEYGDDENE